MRAAAPSLSLLSLLAALALVLAEPLQASERKGRYFGAKETEYPEWFKTSFLDFKEDVAEAAAEGRRVMIIFHQRGCPYCNALVERNFAQKDIVDYTRRHFDAIGINMWGDREVTWIDGKAYTEKTFAAMLRVQFTPTILFLDEEGRVVLRLNGYWPPERFRLALQYVAERLERRRPFREWLAERMPPASSGSLIAEDFFAPPPYDLSPAGRPAGRPFAVFFEQRHCPACETLHRKVLPDPSVREAIRPFHVIQLDMWSDTPVVTPEGRRTTAREWAKALDVKYAPTIVLFAPDGREVIRSEAFFKVFHTGGLFEYVASGAWREQPSFQRFLSARAERWREQGRDVDIWRYADEPVGAGGR